MKNTEEWYKNWRIEKSNNVLYHLVQIVNIFKDKSIFNELLEHLYPALYDATKLLAHFNNADWAPDDRDRIIERGKEGYEEIKLFYGMLEETTFSKHVREYRETLTKIREYIKGPRSPNRTLIYEAILPLEKLEVHWVDEIESLTMKVTNGEIEWEQYIEELKPILDDWEKDIIYKEAEVESRAKRYIDGVDDNTEP